MLFGFMKQKTMVAAPRDLGEVKKAGSDLGFIRGRFTLGKG